MKQLYRAMVLLCIFNVHSAENPSSDNDDSGLGSGFETSFFSVSEADSRSTTPDFVLTKEQVAQILKSIDIFLNEKEKEIKDRELILKIEGLEPKFFDMTQDNAWRMFADEYIDSLIEFFSELDLNEDSLEENDKQEIRARISKAELLMQRFKDTIINLFKAQYQKGKKRHEKEKIQEWVKVRAEQNKQAIDELYSGFKVHVESKMVEAYQNTMKFNLSYIDSVRLINRTAVLLWQNYLKLCESQDKDLLVRNQIAYTAGMTLLYLYEYYTVELESKEEANKDRFISELEDEVKYDRSRLMLDIQVFMKSFKIKS